MLLVRFDVDQNEPAECRFFPARTGESVGRLSCLNDSGQQLRNIVCDKKR